MYKRVTFILLCVILSLGRVPSDSYTDCVEKTCNIYDDSLRFYLYGDWGGKNVTPYSTDIQLKVADTLHKMDMVEKIHFYITTGDNFYDDGVKDENDFRFKTTFEDVYNKPGHYRPWYLIAGNHDYKGNITGQIAYTKKSWRWNFPIYYYTHSYMLNDKTKVELIMIDTIMLCGNVNATYDDTTVGAADPVAADRQWIWIEKKLSQSKANYLFIVGHYPLWSKGYHGPTTLLLPRMVELMSRYNVSAYLSGHDHVLEHVYHQTKRITGIISGMGAKVEKKCCHVIDDDQVLVPFLHPVYDNSTIEDKGGFVLVELNRRKCEFIFYDQDGQKLYSTFVDPRFRNSL